MECVFVYRFDEVGVRTRLGEHASVFSQEKSSRVWEESHRNCVKSWKETSSSVTVVSWGATPVCGSPLGEGNVRGFGKRDQVIVK